jgi:hypothetical protein
LDLSNILIGYSLELTWRICEFFPDLVSKLNYREKITNAKAKAHRDATVLCIRESRLNEMIEMNERRLPAGFADMLSALSLMLLNRFRQTWARRING